MTVTPEAFARALLAFGNAKFEGKDVPEALHAALEAALPLEASGSCGKPGDPVTAYADTTEASKSLLPSTLVTEAEVEAARNVLKNYRKGFWHINGRIVQEALEAAALARKGEAP